MVDKLSPRWRKIVVGISGGSVLIAGIIAIPYPGPGWLIVFAGLGILATEYDWAKSLLGYARGKYDAWQSWVKKQNNWVKIVLFLFTAAIVVVTIWLLNGYGILNAWFNLKQDWVNSPLPIFN